ncbi:hypothetical protein [Bradymonas sediminis]|uniref:Uncharacterized protein n=1 Tax=Bradymonas sediminis TaxID=1548548 RepID=A0A2Z4FHW2_9DELT|nr:hypothetical protein [Bradymonas sediminis]AWV88298.1 hypothetical protein DN745_02655 [Bradymonas sediminis]TDP77421.1 hypothetical protein DFR33_101323 [Bradymonas sediminis]
MTYARCRARSAGLWLGVLLFLAASGCVDLEGSRADNGSANSTSGAESTGPHGNNSQYETERAALDNTAKFRLTAEVVPGGHVSVSNHFVLSGSVDPGLTKTTSSSPHFRLTGKAMTTDP